MTDLSNLDPNLRIEIHGFVGVVTLDRPQTLNALTLGMTRGIARILAHWRNDDRIRAIVFRGAGERAFCAGGDVKALYEAGVNISDPHARTALAREYFADEYWLNRDLFHYPKPTIALMNGITMGGGYGVAGPCRFRVISEKTTFAMPEVGIGFFPDVGSIYFLNRTPTPGVGNLLAISGQSIGAADTLFAGMADVFVPEAEHDELMRDIIRAVADVPSGPDAAADAAGAITAVFGRHTAVPPDGNLARNADAIANIFAENRGVCDVVDQLAGAGDLLLSETARFVLSKAPPSVCVTHEYLRRMRGKGFDAVTAMDYRLAIAFMRQGNFYEGIRAALIDKDKNPRWNPATLGNVPDSVVNAYFSDDIPDLDTVDRLGRG